MTDWRPSSLAELIDIKHGFAFKGQHFVDYETDDVLVTPGNFAIGGGFKSDKLKYYDGPVPEDYILQPGDLIVTMTDLSKQADTLGYSAIVPKDGPRLLHNQRIGLVTSRDEAVSLDFLGWLMRTPGYRNCVIGSATGSTVKHTSPTRIKEFEFLLPPEHERNSISTTLNALDEKIELNRRTNETLEAQARALFRDWFVDFGPVKAKMAGAAPYLAPNFWSLFPDRLGNDGVPNGWVVYDVCDLAEQHTASLNPQSFPDEEFEHFSLPAFDSGRDPTIEQGSNIKSNKMIVPDQAVLLSKLNPEIPRVWWPASSDGRRQIASTEFLAFVPKAGASRSLIYSFFSDPQFRQRLEGMVTGTSKSHQRVSPKALSALEAFSGAPDVMRAFASIADPLMDKVVQNRIESAILAQTRDLLLPKLMSGEVRVGEIAKHLEPA